MTMPVRHGLEGDVLVLLPFPIFPTDQGNRARSHWMLSRLKARGLRLHAVLQLRAGARCPADAHHEHAAFFETFHLAPEARPLLPASGKTYRADEIWDAGIVPTLKRIFRDIPINAVLVNYAPYALAFDHCPPGCTRVIDLHDRLGGRREAMEEAGAFPAFFYLSEAEEKACIDRADLVLAIKEEEADAFRVLSSTPVLTLGVRPPPQKPVDATPRTGRLRCGFLGSDNAVNLQSVDALVAAHRSLGPDAAQLELAIYGNAGRALDPITLPPGVTIFGPVADLATIYRNTDVILSPTIRSTGVKIKAVEALSAGKPLVATADGSNGLPARHPAHLCADIHSVLATCVTLAADPTALRELSDAGARMLHGYLASVDDAENALAEHLARGPLRLDVDNKDPDRVAAVHALSPALQTFWRLVEGDGQLQEVPWLSAGSNVPGDALYIAGLKPTSPAYVAARSVEVKSDLRRRYPDAIVRAELARSHETPEWREGPNHALVLCDGADGTVRMVKLIEELTARGGWPNTTLVGEAILRALPERIVCKSPLEAAAGQIDPPTLIVDLGQGSSALRCGLFSNKGTLVAVESATSAVLASSVNRGQFRPLRISSVEEAVDVIIRYGFAHPPDQVKCRSTGSAISGTHQLMRTLARLSVASKLRRTETKKDRAA